MPQLRFGTCSWKYDSWDTIYTPGAGSHLQQYAQKYNTVEIDQWFWSLFGTSIRLPDPFTAEQYSHDVPEDFIFSVKAPNAITLTHPYTRTKNHTPAANPHFLSTDLFQRFLELIEPLHDKLGPLMFQFEYLNKQKMPSQRQFLDQFEIFIQDCPSGYQYAVEIRNPNYLNDSYFAFLKANKLSHVFLQGYYMPSVTELYQRWKATIAEQPFSVIRLHGPDRKGIEKQTGKVWNRIVASKEDELPDIVDMVADLFERGVDVILNVNNHYEGSAPLTIERLQQRLADRH
jgi:uncharacterized protein YecE (DUF72 family)